MFVIPTIGFKLLCGLVVLRLDGAPRYLIRDRDTAGCHAPVALALRALLTANLVSAQPLTAPTRNRGKSSGTGAFFSCADSSPWTLYIMCCRHAPFLR
jgi:hypothetical protein